MINPYLVLGVSLIGLVIAGIVVWMDGRQSRPARLHPHGTRRR